MLVATTFFLAELGDKTMLMTVGLATDHAVIPVWLGSTFGMVLSDGLAIIVGQLLGAKLPERAIKVGAAVIFFGFGALSTVQGATKLPPYGWATSAVAVALLVSLYLYQARKDRESARQAERVAAAAQEQAPEPVGVVER